MIERTELMILKGIGYVLLIGIMLAVIVWACCGCGSDSIELPESPPKQYDDRFVYAGASGMINVYIDAETGVCYATKAGYEASLTMLVDRNGDPFIANGWRDYSDSDG